MAKKSQTFRRPYVASPDQVRIIRQGNTAIIEYAEDQVMRTHLTIGPELAQLTDEDIVRRHNELLEARDELRRETDYVAVEVPPGKPQIRYFEAEDQWVPRGGVVRVVVTTDLDSPERDPAFVIDDLELTLREFGRMLLTWEGWGLRITATPEDELHDEPEVEVRDPDDHE
jgi:hypothetical protein